MSEEEFSLPEIDLPDLDEPAAKKSPLKGVIITAASALLMGGAATGAAFFLAPGGQKCLADAHAETGAGEGDHGAVVKNVTFVNLEPLVVTLAPGAKSRYLKISISLETTAKHEHALASFGPRIRDTLNTYLRAVEEEDLVRPSSMSRLRAQMLRRVQLAAPGAEISDVLITDFVLN